MPPLMPLVTTWQQQILVSSWIAGSACDKCFCGWFGCCITPLFHYLRPNILGRIPLLRSETMIQFISRASSLQRMSTWYSLTSFPSRFPSSSCSHWSLNLRQLASATSASLLSITPAKRFLMAQSIRFDLLMLIVWLEISAQGLRSF